MPSSLSSSDVREKSDCHDGNLLACLLRPRPMSVRNVSTSGTKGRGSGIGGAGRALWRHRIWLPGEKAVGDTIGRSDDHNRAALIAGYFKEACQLRGLSTFVRCQQLSGAENISYRV